MRFLSFLWALLLAGSALGQTLACHPANPRSDPGTGFVPFGANEQLLVRGGQSGPAWEWALGTDTEAGQKTQGSLDWVSGRTLDWTLVYSGAGTAALEVRDQGSLLFSLAYPSGMDRGNALQLEVATNASIGPGTTIAATLASINAHGAAGALSQPGTNQDSSQSLYVYYPQMSEGFSATGTVTFTYASLPTGARAQFRLRAGNVPCNNLAPSVSLGAPEAGSLHQAGSPIGLAASAQDADGSVAQVEFLANGVPIGADAASPYGIQWTNAAPGTYSLTARATDNAGDQSTSGAVSISVNAQPSVALTSPAPGAVVQAPGSVSLQATASDSDGTISKVEFHQGTTLVGTATASPYGASLSGLASGTYSFTATASDDRGGVATSAPVSITVNAPPTVALTSPANNATFTAPANITITAIASDPDGTIAKVEFLEGATLIAERTAPPYSITWSGVPAGSYSLRARATDNAGASATSAPVTVTVSSAVAQLYFIHVDHLNTPRLVANAAQQTVWRWDQAEPFGNNPADENPSGLGAFDLPLRLPGQYYDRETSLHYNLFRDYDPSLGRYGESDPIGLRGGLNTYAYVDSEPLSYLDPNGLQLAPGAGLGGTSGLGAGGALGGRGLFSGKQKADDPAGVLGEYMQPGPTPIEPILAAPVNPDEVIAGAPVPPFPGIQNLSADCKPGKRVVFVIPKGNHKGRTNIEQEYQCTCGLVTWHLIVTPNGKIVHNHFRTGGAKGSADD